ncbi:hypothetical protein LTR17_013499 [Elasticomyces elasticus]|nr:hypothetical protein LTR17_013499 [Elasticomyces elasticus]
MEPTPERTPDRLDEFPPEIRLIIFKHALSYGEGRLRQIRDARNDHQDIGLLVALVNDSKYGEVCEALYSSNAIVLDYQAQLRNLTLRNVSPGAQLHLTHLELANFSIHYTEFVRMALQDIQTSILALTSRLPKLRSLTIAIDPLFLGYCGVRAALASAARTRQWKLTCTAVGCYRLDCNKSLVVMFKHNRLVQRWKEAKRELASFDDVVDWIDEEEHSYRVTFASLTLSQWIALFDTVYMPEPDGSFDRTARHQVDQDIMRCFDDIVHGCLSMADLKTAELFDTVRQGISFRDLDKGACRAGMLEMISDFLCNQGEEAFYTILKADARHKRAQEAHSRNDKERRELSSVQRSLRTSYTDLVAIAVGIKYEWPAISKLKAAIEDHASAEGSRAASDTEERAE